MNTDVPCCSSEHTNVNEDLQELSLDQDINVWGAKQEKLEEQALNELEIFANECTNLTQENNQNNKQTKDITLDINSYIKRQEEYKKRQEYKKSLEVSDHSKSVANRICDTYKKVKKISKIKTIKKPKVEKHSDSDYVPTDDEIDSGCESNISSYVKRNRYTITKNVDRIKDDGLIENYKSRLELYNKKLEEENVLNHLNNEDVDIIEHYTLKDGLKIPIKTWNKLYSYQQDGVKWLWKLHKSPTGGLLGDEMGLGKTVQIIAFLEALEYSRIVSGRFTGLGPSIIVCPATVIYQWVKHFHEWSPEFRCCVLHQSGSFQGNKINLIKDINKNKGIIITTYLAILKFKGNLLEYNWHYIILDEGHKIRNPTTKICIALKLFRTPHRIMLTGSPMQNNFTELWSLFDFTNPGMLGNLNTFQEHFITPILRGGFANSTPMQEATALSVAQALKNVIAPYLLRRTKTEVQHHICLPNKSEQVLFCSLTSEQKDLYKGFLLSEHVNTILGRGVKNWYSENQIKSNILIAITTLRKICNHPDLYLYEVDEQNVEENSNKTAEEQYGYYKRCGKMVVVSALLKIWKKQTHRVLLFTQSRAMIHIFQNFLEENSYKYLKMDGSTSVNSRQPLIDKFNQDTSYDVFLLTTRVGGIGVNLIGANRVIIYDPDWNPATDTQARERAWRIGQEKHVTIYRLLSAGTIEEKIYQRQVWKQLLSNKILLDPKTQRFFKSSDLHDLFSLQESPNTNPETTNIFHDSRVKIQENMKQKTKSKKLDNKINDVTFTDDKIQQMKNLAQQIAKSMSQKQETNDDKIKKSSFQLELEEERQKKQEEREKLKKLTAAELLQLNRLKAVQKPDGSLNKIDDFDTNVSFSKALKHSERTSKLYHDLNREKRKKRKLSDDEKSNKKSKIVKCTVDMSGTVDGEKVEGLLKCETKKKKSKKIHSTDEQQDNYILEKLFSKKGLSGALQHDSIVNGNNNTQRLRISCEAQKTADKSLEALRKQRLTSSPW